MAPQICLVTPALNRSTRQLALLGPSPMLLLTIITTSCGSESALKECLCVSFLSLFVWFNVHCQELLRTQCNHALIMDRAWFYLHIRTFLFLSVCLSSPLFLSTSCLRVSWILTWQTWGKVGRTSPASSSSTTLSPASAVSSSSGWSLTTKTPKCPRVDSKYDSFFYSDLSSFSPILEALMQEDVKQHRTC